MHLENNFEKIQVLFKNRITNIDLSHIFFKLNENEIGIVQKNYRNLYVHKMNIDEFNRLINCIKSATIKSEQIAIEFFANNKEEIEPLYSNELDHYDVEVDLLSYELKNNDIQLPNFEFDILIHCMDKEDQPIFMYDSRGCCTVSFELNNLNELRAKEIS
jgi:hypothetical protein